MIVTDFESARAHVAQELIGTFGLSRLGRYADDDVVEWLIDQLAAAKLIGPTSDPPTTTAAAAEARRAKSDAASAASILSRFPAVPWNEL